VRLFGTSDDVKTGFQKALEHRWRLLEVLKNGSRQRSSAPKLGLSLPRHAGPSSVSYPRVWGVFQKAAEAAKVGKLATHTMRHSYRSWLDAVGTPIAVQQKLSYIGHRTTMNIYGDVVTNQESEAHSKDRGFGSATRLMIALRTS